MIPLSDTAKRRVGYVLVGFIAAFVVLGFALSIALGDPAAALEIAVLGVAFGLVIALSIRVQPSNGAVWALLWAAFFGLLSDLGRRVALYWGDVGLAQVDAGEVSASPSDLGLLAATGLVAALVFWLPGIYLLAIHAVLLFPSGRAASPLWRALAVISGVMMAWPTIVGTLNVAPWRTTPYDEIVDSQFGVLGWSAALQAPLTVIAAASLVNLVHRYRRSTGDERLKFRWVTWALAVFVIHLFLRLWTAIDVGTLVSTLALANIAVAFGIAIVRHRLFDIDVIISKSVMYLGLGLVVTAVYALIVAGPLLVMGQSGDGDQNLVLPIVATGVVAVLFEPARSRMQRWANRFVYGKRSSPHEVLSQVTARLSASRSEHTTGDLASLLAEGTGAEAAVVWFRRGDRLQPEGVWPADRSIIRESIAAADLIADELTAVSEVRHGDELLGAVSIVKPRSDPATPADRELVSAVAAGAGLVLRNIGLNRQLEERVREVRRSRQRLIAAQDDERHRLERNLHDGAQQQVVALKVKLGIARTLADRAGVDEIASLVSGLAGETQQAVDALRSVAHGIYPPLLEAEGLDAALRALQRTSAVAVTIATSGLNRYQRHVEETVYFCMLEAIDRVHMSGASVIRVDVGDVDGALIVQIDHDGRVTLADLAAMSDRVDAFDGTIGFEVVSDDLQRITTRLPADHQALEPA